MIFFAEFGAHRAVNHEEANGALQARGGDFTRDPTDDDEENLDERGELRVFHDVADVGPELGEVGGEESLEQRSFLRAVIVVFVHCADGDVENVRPRDEESGVVDSENGANEDWSSAFW